LFEYVFDELEKGAGVACESIEFVDDESLCVAGGYEFEKLLESGAVEVFARDTFVSNNFNEFEIFEGSVGSDFVFLSLEGKTLGGLFLGGDSDVAVGF
jgi:hypothetical protein